jgi:hypothetical protein
LNDLICADRILAAQPTCPFPHWEVLVCWNDRTAAVNKMGIREGRTGAEMPREEGTDQQAEVVTRM